MRPGCVHRSATPRSRKGHSLRARQAQTLGQMTHADIHFHLLHGVDDGPETLAESVALARAAVADGTRVVVCTPHVRRTS